MPRLRALRSTDATPSSSAVREQYARLADKYDRRWAGYLAATMRETLQRLDLQPHDRVLDVGCGTGALIEALKGADPTLSVAGVDIAPEMLRIARDRLGSSVPLIAGNVEEMPFRAESFDVVVSISSFHYWERPRRALEEIARVLCPGGRLVITDWCDDYLTCRVCDLALRLLDRSHHRSYGSRECRRLLDGAGYELRTLDRYKITWLWGLMTATTRTPTAP